MRPSRLLPALTGLLLVLTGVVTGPTGPVGAASTGTVAITVVDEHGDPLPGHLQLFDGEGYGLEAQGATLTINVPVGEYGVTSISPWGGILCAGIQEDCSYRVLIGGTLTTDGSVAIAAGRTTAVRIEGERPVTLRGPARVGRELAVSWSAGTEALLDYFALIGAGAYDPTVQWLRDGEPIKGATDPTYRPRGADAGRTVAARVTYPPVVTAQYDGIGGQTVTPRTTNGLKVAKVATRAFATIADPTVSADRQGRVRVDVTAPNQVVTGTVTVAVGDWSRTRSLRNGSARIVLPRLAPGRHTVTARYLGTSVYAPSTAKATSITVG